MDLPRFQHFYVLFFVLWTCQSQVLDGPVIETDSGQIKGFIEQSSKGRDYYTFHRIPFAEPPTGKLRFKNPVKITPWSGVRDGSLNPVSCPGPDLLTYLKDNTFNYEGQEDCLFLSVYTPKIEKTAPLPVLLFIHGGGFISLSGGIFHGYELMNEDVVYVSIDYRTGVLGFLSTEDDVMPGNLGLKDQTMALQWVHDNIAHFGGDPNRITLFGNSAGGASVHYHILSPASKGLFSRAIIQSGTALCPWTHAEGQKSIAHQVGAAVGCFTPADIGEKQSQRLLSCLQNVDVEDIAKIMKKFLHWNFLPNNFTPFVDGKYIPDEPELLMKEGRHNDVEIMIGVTQQDGAWITESLYSENDQRDLLNNDFDYYGPISVGVNYENSSEATARKIFKHYLGKLEVTEENADKVTEMYGDAHFIIGSDLVALMHSDNVKSSGKKVYYYELDYRGQRSLLDFHDIKFGSHWIAHADEVFYLFPMHEMGGFPKRDANDSYMRDLFVKMWANFAAEGNPTPDSSLGFTWKPFTRESPQHLSIKLKSEMKDDSRKKIRQFWSTLPTRQNQMLFGSKDKANSPKSEL